MIQVDHLAAGPDLSLEAVRIGAGGGPRVAILGGVHGDEIEGVLAAQRLIAVLGARPVGGTVTVLARANPPALVAGTRLGADSENLARVFPGDARGSLSSRIADTISRELIDECDLLIDLHSAGRRYRMPALCGLPAQGEIGGRPLLDLARVTTFPFLWSHPSIGPGRSVSHAEARGTPWLYFECGGSGSLLEPDIDRYVTSTLRLLTEIGVLGGEPVPPSDRQVVVTDGNGDTDAGIAFRSSGFFVSRVAAGDTVEPGRPLGAVYDQTGAEREIVRAVSAGVVMMLRHDYRVEVGDVAAIVAGTDDRAA
ncbi:succinylglutamate desuccinylase/aspartoacylase family protein [Actinoallomurus sp. CA-142502]|uniref:succinylglutamate desuccinylase/aspartoacylase family protein n=1 Tax=Actinoallomurus sp. CA-142502 TaxID=3239885 RepID=UPI003D8CE22A